MADENVLNENEDELLEKPEEVKPIRLTDNETGDIYILEFNRESVKWAEKNGFDTGSTSLKLSEMEDLFYYSFRMHQPTMTKQQTNAILYNKLHGFPSGMVKRLINLYTLPYRTLIQKQDDEKNVKMTVEF